jgi:hypothetical protein
MANHPHRIPIQAPKGTGAINEDRQTDPHQIA